jgi:hypothetical protein
MARLAQLGLLMTAFVFVLGIPGRSSAEGPSYFGTDGYQGYYRGSYSCSHYWLPSLYRWRAYHRESDLRDSPPYDQFPESHRWSRHSCSDASAIAPSEKVEHISNKE